MKVLSRTYGVGDNHVRFVTMKCLIEERPYSLNENISWKAKKEWLFEFVKYENQDHCMVRFDEMDDSVFIIKSLDYSEHSICDHLYKEDSNNYVKWILLMHITKLFENSSSFPDFRKYANVLHKHVEFID